MSWRHGGGGSGAYLFIAEDLYALSSACGQRCAKWADLVRLLQRGKALRRLLGVCVVLVRVVDQRQAPEGALWADGQWLSEHLQVEAQRTLISSAVASSSISRI